MQFYYDSSGKCLATVPEKVYQNSVNATTVFFIGAFPSTAQVTVAFTLPNKIPTTEHLMTCVRNLSGDVVETVNAEQLEKIEQTGFKVWSVTLPVEVTQYYGTVQMQFYVYPSTGAKIAVESTSFEVSKGVSFAVPDSTDPYEAILNEILAAIGTLKTEYGNLLFLNLENGEGAGSFKTATYTLDGVEYSAGPVTGRGGFTIGKNSTNSGFYCGSFGSGNNVAGYYNYLFGVGLDCPDTTKANYFAVGYNDAYNNNIIFNVGNGADQNHRANAFQVLKDGRAKVQSAPKDPTDVVRKKELDQAIANAGGGGKLYLHEIGFECYMEMDTAIQKYCKVSFYCTRKLGDEWGIPNLSEIYSLLGVTHLPVYNITDGHISAGYFEGDSKIHVTPARMIITSSTYTMVREV